MPKIDALGDDYNLENNLDNQPKLCPRYTKGMPMIYPRYAYDLLKICPRYAKDMPET